MVRPNYVKFTLQEIMMENLHKIAIWIKNNCHNINFIPIDKINIHITLCFLGDIIKNYHVDKKLRLKEIHTVINKFNTFLSNSDLPNNLIFEKYDLFPESKQNLIVAKFKCSEKFMDTIIEFKKQFIIFGINDNKIFVPHVTLGKIQFKYINTHINLCAIPTENIGLIKILGCKFV